MPAGNVSRASEILRDFADRTGLTNPRNTPRRYLWTDAHAVCTFLSLYRATGEASCRRLALDLVEQVHAVLGRHRDDGPKTGWISGLADAEGQAHPTAGGLRIGKPLRERRRGEPLDERLEWERDGQYFHYLTKWMHALCRVAAVTGEARYGEWACELAESAYTGFVTDTPRGKRLYWKMSIELSYPLVTSSGHHDPLDGYVTFAEIAAVTPSRLGREMSELQAMLARGEWATPDPLGIGGLLFDASRVIAMTAAGRMPGSALAGRLVAAAETSLAVYARETHAHLPADRRLGFRELGLALGLRGIERMRQAVVGHPQRFAAGLTRGLDALSGYETLAAQIEAFWQEPAHQRVRTWQEHLDINAATLATCLLPDEYLAA